LFELQRSLNSSRRISENCNRKRLVALLLLKITFVEIFPKTIKQNKSNFAETIKNFPVV